MPTISVNSPPAPDFEKNGIISGTYRCAEMERDGYYSVSRQFIFKETIIDSNFNLRFWSSGMRIPNKTLKLSVQ